MSTLIAENACIWVCWFSPTFWIFLCNLHWRKDRRPDTLLGILIFISVLLWILGRVGLEIFLLCIYLSACLSIWSLKWNCLVYYAQLLEIYPVITEAFPWSFHLFLLCKNTKMFERRSRFKNHCVCNLSWSLDWSGVMWTQLSSNSQLY